MAKIDTRFPAPFSQYDIGAAFDEMFDGEGVAREHYRAIYRRLLELPAAELQNRQQAADQSFLHQGITFTVYGNEEGTERIFPYDLLPRIITGAQWDTIERGLNSADHRAESVSARHLSRGANPER